MASVERVAHFVVEGAFITETARNLLLSDSPSKAWRLIKSSLIGGDQSQIEKVALEVLTGEKKLTGDSSKGIRVVKDRSSVNYRKTMGYIYAGRVKIKNAWYRPDAEVTAFGSEDGREASRLLPENMDDLGTIPEYVSLIRKWWKNRALHYANEGTICVEIPFKENQDDFDHKRVRFFLFEPAGEPPFWKDELRTPQEAIREFLATGHRIREVGAIDPEEDEDTSAKRIEREEAECEIEFLVEEELAREVAYQARIVKIREDVLKQADGDLFELVTKDGKKYQVPRAPFVNWALRRASSIRHLAPPWTEVSLSGMKMQMDDPYHTDWLIGAGISLEEGSSFSRSPVMEAALDKMGEIQQEIGHFDSTVLATASVCDGIVGESIGCIFILKDLRNSPENNEAIEKARGIITENGGELSHLSIIAREMRIPIFRVKDARKRFVKGMRLRLDSENGWIHHDPVRPSAEEDDD